MCVRTSETSRFHSTHSPLRASCGPMNVHFFDKSEAGGGATPTRAEAAVADTWDLAPLYPTPDGWTADFARLQKEYPTIERFRGKLGESPAVLAESLEADKL